MNKDQKLIFEAYTETLTEGWEAGTSKAPKGKSFDMSRGGAPSNVNAARDGSGGRYRKTRPPSAQSNKTHGEMEEDSLDNTSLEELSILSPEEYEMVQNFENFDADDWGYNTLQRFYFRKREGGESEETSSEDDNDQYAPDEAPADDQLGGLEPLDAEDDDNIKESWQENNPIPAQFLDSEETKKNIIDSNIYLDTVEEVYKVAVVDFWNYLKEKGIL